MKQCPFVIALIALSISEPAGAYQIVRTDDRNVRIIDIARGSAIERRPFPWSAPAWIANLGRPSRVAQMPTITVVARSGQAMPIGEEGYFLVGATYNPAAVDRHGRIAFFAQVLGASRNQGIFFSGSSELEVIAMGCGAGGGSGSTASCGDPAPIGGTFSGMFLGTTPAPAMNDNGDVVFVADVAGGSAPRGLFLYRTASDDIVKIAAVGDASPRGGTLSAIGPGSINNHGRIAFLASTGGNGSQGSDILLWHNGVVTTYVAVGDPAPGGGTFLYIGSEAFGYEDGTYIPGGPVPAINDSNQIAFSGATQSTVGHLLSQDGVHAWQVRTGDAAPSGGVYLEFAGAPVLNGRGDIAFLAYFGDSVAGPTTGAGWFAGSPSLFRRALAFPDPVADGITYVLAYSRNPFRPLDDAGNLAVWTARLRPDMTERDTMMISRADGTRDVIASQGDAAPLLSTWENMNPWPTANSANQILFGAAASGNGGTGDAHFLATHAVDIVFRDGFENSVDR